LTAEKHEDEFIESSGVTYRFTVTPSLSYSVQDDITNYIILKSGLSTYFKNIKVSFMDGCYIDKKGLKTYVNEIKGKRMIVEVFCPEPKYLVNKNKEEDYYKELKESFSDWIINLIKSVSDSVKLDDFLYTLSGQRNDNNVDVHKIITTSFNVKLNPYISNFEPKKGSFETVMTGGITEIRVIRDRNDFLSGYALRLQDFRENIFMKSVNWRFPLNSFISELDILVEFYYEIVKFTNNQLLSEKDHEILSNQLIIPLKDFLYSLDTEFNSDYFSQQIKNWNPKKYVPKSYILTINVKDNQHLPLKDETITVYKQENTQPKQLIESISTDNLGLAITKLPKGYYVAEWEKYHLSNSLELTFNSSLTFTKPSFLLTANIYDAKKRPIKNIEIRITSNEDQNNMVNTKITGQDGNIVLTLPFGDYLIEVKKYNLSKSCMLYKNCTVDFTLPKKDHWWHEY
jgi:hypothetical protein